MSFVDPKEGANQDKTQEKTSPSPEQPKKEPLFVLLEEIRDAIQAKEAQEAHHQDRIATALETIAKKIGYDGYTKPPLSKEPYELPIAPATPTPSPPTSKSVLEEIKSLFPNDLADLLNFEDKDGYIRISPRRFLGSENFAKIASIIRSANGEYVSAGKDSHFKVQKK